MSNFINRHVRTWANATRQQAMAEAYRPIISGFLLPGSAYYLFVTWGHWRDETGAHFLFLGGLSLVTAVLYAAFRRFVILTPKISMARLEVLGIAINLLIYANVLAYMLLHFEEEKLVYFVLMAVVFSTSGVTLRATIASVGVSIATLFWLASASSPERFHQFAFIGVATSFASFGMATLLRKAILRQIDARLMADQLASRDSLTGIANRRAIFAALDQRIAEKKSFWLGIMDLDGFKSINDIYGHVVGDSLLTEVVKRIEEHAPDNVTLGRIGGDEFAIVVAEDLAADGVATLGAGFIAAITEPFDIATLQLNISATIGFAQFPAMGATAREIYEKADFALYRGKQRARSHPIVFDVAEDQEMRETIALERALREADLEQELYLLFQPQMDVTANRVVGFEALARWNSPRLGAVRPDKFIRAAERAGLIQRVTAILFGKGLDALRTWPENVSISFNLSAQDLSDRAFIFSLIAQVFARGVDPGRIEFEITETAVMADIEASRRLLQDVSAAGFKIALDDFGSGYSSFEYIDQLPLDKVKIDKSFVRKVPHSVTSREIVAGVITLCRNLNLKCVLEGVETEGEMAILSPLSPQIIQGYLFGRPMDNSAIGDLLERTSEQSLARAGS